MGTWNLTVERELGGRRLQIEGRKPEEDQPKAGEQTLLWVHCARSTETSPERKPFGVASRHRMKADSSFGFWSVRSLGCTRFIQCVSGKIRGNLAK